VSYCERRGSSRLCLIAAAAFAIAVGGCGDSDHHNSSSEPATVAVLSAFPAELAAVLSHVTVKETRVVEDHVFRIGTLDGQPVIAAMTGVGLINAATTTNLLLDNFEVSGVIVSGVAGSVFHIGDVAVPEAWHAADGTIYAVDPEWLALAEDIAANAHLDFEQCTSLPLMPAHEPVCLPNQPVMVVGGFGRSSDPFGGRPDPCTVGAGDIFGCDVSPDSGAAAVSQPHATQLGITDPDAPVAEDEETAAIAQAALEHGVRFIAFRATSDGQGEGAGDPLGLPGFPAQFFAYYRLAAHNAAAGAAALVGRL